MDGAILPTDIFDYECPLQGIDFDIIPPPLYGSTVECSACGGKHLANEILGNVTRYFENEKEPIDLTDVWKTKVV